MIKKSAVFLLLCLLFHGLYGEEIYIERIDVSIKGMTNSLSLLRVSELKEGQIFSSVEDLENNLGLAKDRLDDTRLFNTVEISYELRPAEQDKRPVIVLIDAEDSWNIMALPYPKYDSNDGFVFKLAARDYNFLGLMEPLRINFVYEYDENQKHNFSAELDYTVNFPIAGHSFSLGFSQDFNYTHEESYGDDFYMSSGMSLGTSFQLPWDIYDGNKISYSLSTSIGKDYIPWHTISEYRDEIGLSFSHGFSLGHTSWDGNNYRDGITYSISNGWSYDIDDDKDFDDSWATSLSGNTKFHKDMYPMGYSGRIGFSQNLRDGDTSDTQGPFRGIKAADDIDAEGYLYFNNALYITVWNNLDFWEIMGGPCLDLGYRWGIPESAENQDAFLWSIAVDGLCHPAFAKSFQARITIGMSGNGFMEGEGEALSRVRRNLELFFGLGKFF